MTSSLLVTLVRHAGRSLLRGGLPLFFAVMMTALSLFALAAFTTMLLNFERVAKSVGESIGAVCFLKVDDAAAAEEVRAAVSMLPDVAAAKLTSPEEALVRAKRALGDTGKLLEGTAGVRMPWVVEVTPKVGAADRDAMVRRLQTIPGVDEVMHPGGEVKRIEALLDLLRGTGLFLAFVIALVVLVVVSNAVKLTVFARKDEIAILKLVGATDLFVRVPLLLSGLAQGVVGAGLALVALVLLHGALAGIATVAFSGAIGAFVLEPLPPAAAAWILLGGAVLGLFGAAISIGRFLRV
jgi:cell division transport system permease protein